MWWVDIQAHIFSAGRYVSKSTGSGDLHEVGLQLLGGDVGNSVSGALGGLERQEIREEASNMGRGHRGTRDGVGGVLATLPGREDVETRSKDVVALAEVGEVGTLVSGSGGVAAGVGVIVPSGNGEVDAGVDGSIDSQVKSLGLATTKRHVGCAALEFLILTLGGSLGLLGMADGGHFDALHDVGHGARAVGTENLDGVDVGFLGDAVFLASNGARAVSTMSVAILISVALGNGLGPVRSALEVDVLDVGAGVDDIDVDALTTVIRKQVLVEGAEAQRLAVRDTS